VRLFTRRGYDWSGRYPAIARAAAKLRARSFTLDGEATVCGPDGVAVFDALHRRGTVTEAMLYAFDLLELDGADLRALPLGERKARLAKLLARTHRVSPRLQARAGGDRVEAVDCALPVRPLPGLDQGEEPGQSCDDPTPGGTMVTGRRFPPPWSADKIRRP